MGGEGLAAGLKNNLAGTRQIGENRAVDHRLFQRADQGINRRAKIVILAATDGLDTIAAGAARAESDALDLLQNPGGRGERHPGHVQPTLGIKDHLPAGVPLGDLRQTGELKQPQPPARQAQTQGEGILLGSLVK